MAHYPISMDDEMLIRKQFQLKSLFYEIGKQKASALDYPCKKIVLFWQGKVQATSVQYVENSPLFSRRAYFQMF